MIWAIVLAGVIVMTVGIAWVDARGYRQGFRAGRRYEQQLASDELKRQLRRLASTAEHNIDYLYERTRRQIKDLS